MAQARKRTDEEILSLVSKMEKLKILNYNSKEIELF
jgi:hypothetical protein